MGIFSFLKAAKQEAKIGSSTESGYVSPPQNDEFKAYIPNFLYKPPFGYPLNKNVLHLKSLAKNPFIFSVIRTLKDEASTTKWEIKLKKEYAEEAFKNDGKDNNVKKISDWFYNPNGNDESFNDIVSQWVVDLCEVDAAVGVKVFTKGGEFSQLFARDGGSFLKNPDIYGYMGNRDEFVYPYASVNPNMQMPYDIKVYSASYAEKAAYFQYGWTGNALPVPFGRRELIYIAANPRTDSIYGRSPLEIIEDVLITLVYGVSYNTDFYLNGNMPDGMVNLVGADDDIAKAFQERLKNKFTTKDDVLGFNRRLGHQYPVYGGPDAKFIPFQISSKDMEIIEQQKWFTKLVWSAFGVTPDEMGYTEDSNKAVSQTQTGVHKRKALKPLLKKIEYAINNQIMPELDPTGKYEFAFEDYDIDEELKKAQLYQQQITGGWKTAEMVAEEEGIDMKKLQQHKAEEEQKEIAIAKETNPGFLPKPTAKAVKLKAEYVQMSVDDLIEEHARLVTVLEELKPEDVKEELEEQKKELESYIDEKKKSLMKNLKVGDTVKIMNASIHAGQIGKIEQIFNNGNENYYQVTFVNGSDLLFPENIKKIRDADFNLSEHLMTNTPIKVKSEHDDEISEYFKAVKKDLLERFDINGSS